MEMLLKGRYRARLAESEDDLAASLALRDRVFRKGKTSDRDAFDGKAQHILIEDHETRQVLASFRLLSFASGQELGGSYSAQFYKLGNLKTYPKPILEMGRFCVDPARIDADILRVAWGALTRIVDERGVGLLCGCTSFQGADPEGYSEAFALMQSRHQAPKTLRVGVKAPEVYAYAQLLAGEPFDPREAQAQLPPLLRSYLQLGGWVSDHAVIDRDLDTLHVFTALEISAIPPARASALRLIAG